MAPARKAPRPPTAVELVEDGQAEVVVVAYFDRLVRSLTVQAEVVERIEQAGGGILAVDVGEVRADTASRWLSSTMLGLVAEYHRRSTSERTADAKRRAVMRGAPPFPPHTASAKTGRSSPTSTRQLSPRRSGCARAGPTVMEVREHLRQHGVERSFHGTQALLRSRIPLGEIRFGAIVNAHAHEAIVDADTWRRVQRQIVSRGRRPEVGTLARAPGCAPLRHLRRADGHRDDGTRAAAHTVCVLQVQSDV